MLADLRALLIAIFLLVLPLTSFAQFNLIQLIPGQLDDEFGLTGTSVIQAANSDVLVIYGKNGEVTTPGPPAVGEPAELVMHRKRGGLFWDSPVVLDTAIDNGVQSLGNPHMVRLPDDRILLTYFYHNDFFPNFSVSFKVRVSSDNGASWEQLNDKAGDTAALSVTPGGTVVSIDWVEGDDGSLSFHSSSYDAQSDSWISKGLVIPVDSVCTQSLHTESDTEWHLYYADCVFGYGGTNTIYRLVSTDAGGTWSAAEELFTADSGFGTFGSIVAMADGSLTVVYSNGTVISYRTSTDNGANWSEASDWTSGTEDTRDLPPMCSAGKAGPICVFPGRRGTENQLLHIGIVGRSGDPLSGAESFAINSGFNDAWFNPATAGQGFLITVFPDISIMFIAWFTFDTERPDESVQAILGDPGHRWLTAQGPYSGDTALLDIAVTRGGVFDSSDPAPQGPSFEGTLEIVFESCLQGVVKYSIPGLGLMGEIPIQRIALDNVALCETLMQ